MPPFLVAVPPVLLGLQFIGDEGMEVEKVGESKTVVGSGMEVENAASSAAPPRPQFKALKPHEMSDRKIEFRKVSVPQHRFAPLKRCWMEIYTPIYEQMKIDIRMNLKV